MRLMISSRNEVYSATSNWPPGGSEGERVNSSVLIVDAFLCLHESVKFVLKKRIRMGDVSIFSSMIPVLLYGGERSVIRSSSLRAEVICTYHKNAAGSYFQRRIALSIPVDKAIQELVGVLRAYTRGCGGNCRGGEVCWRSLPHVVRLNGLVEQIGQPQAEAIQLSRTRNENALMSAAVKC